MNSFSSSRDDPDPVRPRAPLECRLSREVYVVIGIWIVTGVGLQIFALVSPPPRGSVWETSAVLAAMFHLPSLFFVFWAERIRVWADENGLRFRGLGRTRFVAWQNIEDFGWKANTNSNSAPAQAQIFVRGRRKPQMLVRSLTHFEELLERIALNATTARVKSWQPLEARDEGEWPKVFAPRDVPGWHFVAGYFGFTFLIFALLFLKAATYGLAPLLAGISTTWNGLDIWGRIAFVGLPFALCGAQPLLILARFPAIKNARRFLGQRIVATREGLAFERDAHSEFVKWENIERFELEAVPGHFQLPLGVVHTRYARFEFHTAMPKSRELRALIAHRATSAATREWKYGAGGDEDILGGARSLWAGGTVGVGPRLHHYRTRTNRVILLLGAVLFAPMPFFAVYGRAVNGVFKAPGLEEYIMLAVFFVLLFLPTLWGTLGFWFSRVESDENGLRQRGVWGERRLSWSQIRRARFNGYCLELSGEAGKMRIGLVADLAHLREEIQRRSVPIETQHEFKLGQ